MSTRELDIICDACGCPIGDNDGYVWVDQGEINRYTEAVRLWDEETGVEPVPGRRLHSLKDIYDSPKRVRWQAHHAACDPDPDGGPHHMTADRLRTWSDLVEWTAHWMSHPWLNSTDWSDVLRSAAGGAGARITPRHRTEA